MPNGLGSNPREGMDVCIVVTLDSAWGIFVELKVFSKAETNGKMNSRRNKNKNLTYLMALNSRGFKANNSRNIPKRGTDEQKLLDQEHIGFKSGDLAGYCIHRISRGICRPAEPYGNDIYKNVNGFLTIPLKCFIRSSNS
ncbi:hypothetical protein TNCV_3960721 [Trichonephila clavipes]|nr:hypothetical protein TNCV_3960721 [Trichonephila clavipes]